MVAPNFGTSKGKAYEVWVMLEIVFRLMQLGVDIFPHDRADVIEPFFRVSGSPADMPAKGPSGDGPCHFKLQRKGRWFELHLGLNNQGLSTTTHEIDLVVLPCHEGLTLRQVGGGPYAGSVMVGLELKAYSDTHKLDHSVPRALLGVAVDLDPAWAIQGWTVHTVGGGGRKFDRHGRAQLAVITATTLYDSSRTLLTHHGAGAHDLVLPGGNEGALDHIAAQIDALFD